jgi:hypothetical protein
MPVDADPATVGRGFRLDEHDGDEVLAVFTADPAAHEKLYVSHFASCPHANVFRK